MYDQHLNKAFRQHILNKAFRHVENLFIQEQTLHE